MRLRHSYLHLALVICLGLTPAITFASVPVPDELTSRKIQLTKGDTHGHTKRDLKKFGKKHPRVKQDVPNGNAARKVLQELTLPENLDSNSPTLGGYGEVYLAKNYVVKISKPSGSTTPERELAGLLDLKRRLGANPSPGLTFCWPKVAYETSPAGHGKAKPKLGVQPFNMYVYDRVNPVKSMKTVVWEALVFNSTGSRMDICAFGECLGRFQASSLLKIDNGRYVSNAHMDLNYNNILPTGLPSLGQAPAFSLIDVADVRLAADPNAPELPIDPLYFVLISIQWTAGSEGYRNLSPSTKKRHIQAFAKEFFLGLLKPFSNEVREELKPIYTTSSAINIFTDKSPGNNRRKVYHANIFRHYDAWILPAIREAFQDVGAQPSAMPAPIPGLPADFNVQAYLDIYPDVAREAPHFKMDPLTFAAYQYVNWGRFEGSQNEGRLYLTGPLDVPADFCAEAYAEMYPDIALDAPRFCLDPLVFAKVQYHKWGRTEGRLVLTKKIEVPTDFNAQKYLDNYPHFYEEAKQYGVDPLIYARAQYSQWGKGEGRSYQ